MGDENQDIGDKLIGLLIDHDCRITYDNRWLVGNLREPHGIGYENYYVVYSQGYKQKYPRVLYEGTNLLAAMEHLVQP